MQSMKAAGGMLLGLGAMVLIATVGVAILFGMTWVTAHVYPWVLGAAQWAFVADILVLLPLAIFRATRGFSSGGFMASAWAYGLANWMYAFLTAFRYFGALGVFIGLCLAGIGVIPIAVLGALFRGAWAVLGNLALGILLWAGATWFGNYLSWHSGPKNAFVGA